jgi:enoyl-CoA hydratase/carnithine racemase
MTSLSPVRVDRKGAVATVRLEATSTSCRVLLTPDHLQALSAILTGLARDDELALVLLASGGREFCLGADIPYLRSCRHDAAEAYLRQGREVFAVLATLPVPTIAAVGGAAMGGGFELALACDLCWAHPRAVFSLPEARHRLIPAWHAIPGLRRLPSAQAWELLVGQAISARRAHAIGLVGRLFDGGDFAAWADTAAATMAELGRPTLTSLKSLWRTVGQQGHEARAIRACLAPEIAESVG